MQPNGSRGRKPYDYPGRHSPRQGVDESMAHQNSPSRRRGLFEPQNRNTLGGATSRLHPPQSSEGSTNTEAHPPSKDAPWMEYFSVEHRRLMKYNPVTGETCNATESTEPSQADTTVFSSGRGLPSDIGGVRESAKKTDTNTTFVEGESKTKPALHRLPRSSDNPATGASPIPIPSSLSVSHTMNRTAVQSQSLPANADEMDRPVTVRDMERFTETIQATIREIGANFIKAIGDLHQQEGGSEEGGEDDL